MLQGKNTDMDVGTSTMKRIKQETNDESLDYLPPKKKYCTSLRPEEIRHVKENIETTRTRKRNINRNIRKNDVDISSSDWTVEMLSNYVDFEKSVDKIKLKSSRVSVEQVNKIVANVLRQIQYVEGVMFTPSTSFADNRQPKIESGDIYDLSGIQRTEADIRIRLDAILFPIANEIGLAIETEKCFRNKNLPSCKFDYRLFYQGNVVGLVEAKSRNGLQQKSVVQGVLQLCALQAEVYKMETRLSNEMRHLTFSNIISDGYHVIFMQLYQNKLLFDHQPGRKQHGHDVSTLRYYKMDSEKSIKKIVEKMTYLLMQSVEELQEGSK
ncbi:uncharacterized protein [Argopecten irradians]|uniref:uncharacterized protein n=1 Tax=Argopecten irradians TaxID=31199 RepID=UPI0037182B5B